MVQHFIPIIFGVQFGLSESMFETFLALIFDGLFLSRNYLKPTYHDLPVFYSRANPPHVVNQFLVAEIHHMVETLIVSGF